MNPSRPPAPRKLPKQSRSLILVKSIQQACLQILKQEGPESLTTQRIADVAGVNIASLYQYFPNKEAILAQVFEEQIDEYIESARDKIFAIDRLSRTDFRATVCAIVDMELDQRLLLYRMEPAFYSTYQQSLDIHARVDELTVSMKNPSWGEWFVDFLAMHREALSQEELATLSKLASHTLTGTLDSVVRNEPELLEQPSFREELYRLLLALLARDKS